MNNANNGLFSLKPRLNCAANMVRERSRIADIGTDHAYLPIWLAKNGKIAHAIASDIRRGPYLSADNNIRTYGVSDIVEARLGAGLETVKENEVDDIIICGMGGELIAGILGDCPFIKDSNLRLILQPMSHPEIVRRFLCENGFELLCEQAVLDGGHYYTVMCAQYTAHNKQFDDAFYYIGLLTGKDNCEQGYLNNIYKHTYNRYKGCSLSGDTENAAVLEEVCKAIKEAIDNNN